MDEKRPPRPQMQKEITCENLGNGIYNIATPPVGFQQYLILGQEKALLIDSGMGIGSLRKEVEKITDLPVILINTHGHPDHAGGNAEFAPALMCPAEFDVYEQMATLEYRKKDSGPKGCRIVASSPWSEAKPMMGFCPMDSLPKLEVRIRTVLEKSTTRPAESVSRPSSSTCNREESITWKKSVR